jgi:hypothetical protein
MYAPVYFPEKWSHARSLHPTFVDFPRWQPPKRKAESQLYLFEVTAQEKEIIESGLRKCQGRVFGPSGADAKSGFARSTLESKIRSLRIDKNRFRPHWGT